MRQAAGWFSADRVGFLPTRRGPLFAGLSRSAYAAGGTMSGFASAVVKSHRQASFPPTRTLPVR